MFEKILIANRGEIALRVQRACKDMGIATVAVHSTADSDAMHVRLADETVCIGPAPVADSYLNAPAIISAATLSGADAIHPGYGFLSESSQFARMVEAHNIVFIGPSADHIAVMGDKISAKATIKQAGLPVVPGSDGPVESVEAGVAAAEEIGYPVIVKASAGGGGRGMKIAHSAAELSAAIPIAKSEAKSNFGDDTIYLEKFLDKPRHIEVQILADNFGTVVHLNERDCSLQRKHQKVLEEAPAPHLSEAEREKICQLCCAAVAKIGYRNAGTLEFLYDNGEFYFIEMNTRIQVEHPVTEMICGIDLVRESIRIAAGEAISFQQKNVRVNGHAIECRICAEDSLTFTPSPGRVSSFHAAGGIGVRMDSALYSGYEVPPYYDSLVAKLIVHGADREQCLSRLRRALGELVIDGIETTVPLHQRLVEHPDILAGDYDIHWLEKFIAADD